MSASSPSDSVYRGPQPPSIDLPVLRVTRHGRPPAVVKPHEAKVAARGIFDSMVLTSPNMDYIPEYPVESLTVDSYSDGRYGNHEYSRWPQNLMRDMWHVACIPSKPLPPHVPAVLYETLFPETHWVQERTIGFSGVGYIVKETRDALLAAAESAIRRCEETKAPDNVAKHGRLLIRILRQVVDRMRFYPVTARVAIRVGAHVQRVCLELAGLKMYMEIVDPRLRSMHDCSTSILPVVGAFVREASDLQTCVRVGLPTWFLRPLTHELAIWEVVECRPAFFASHSWQSIELLTSVPNPTKNWLSNMLLLVSEHITGTHLTPMNVAELPVVEDEENPTKRRRVGEGESEVSLGVAVATQSTSSKKKKKSKRGRSNPQGEVQPVRVDSALARAPSASTLPVDLELESPGPDPVASPSLPAGDPHPSKTFTPSPFYDVAPVWATALQAAPPLERSAAHYYYPPPFLLDTVSSVAPLPTPCAHPERARTDEKAHRYLHNFVRIREFCRMRMFDVTIASEPLSNEEWRVALWGDYEPPKLSLSLPFEFESSENLNWRSRRSKHRREGRNRIVRLFGTVAHFPSYHEDETVQLADVQVDIAAVGSNPRVRAYILWETHEVNFRAELLCLDTLMMQKPTWSFSQKLQREFFVSRVWGPPSSIMHIFPNDGPRDRAFRWFSPPAREWKDSRETLWHFTQVLSSWPDCPDDVRQGFSREVSEEVFAGVQAHAVDFYVRVFVKTFGRLPIPPICMPSS
ncbi:hypothetical protein LXA43DRAFT_1089747 [Ganoderma leucocontextum]|nr:hypothetical protein LXA43DRAFT_1089747 [Ganoderma leucocontextum]